MNLKSFLKKSWDEGTQIGKSNCIATAILGSGAHFCFPFIFHFVFGIYENFFLRIIATLLCLSVLFIYKMKLTLRVSLYWHFVFIYVLPFIFTVNLLKSNFNELWLYWEIFMIFVLITYIPNWFIFLIDLTIGVLFAVIYYFITSSSFEFTIKFDIILYSIVVSFSAVVGVAFAYINRSTSLQKLEEQHKKLLALAGSIVHEIRNPLSAINLVGENLKDLSRDIDGKIREEYNSLINSLFSSIKQSNEIINIVLNDLKDKPINESDFAYLDCSSLSKIIATFGFKDELEKQKVTLLKTNLNFHFKAVPDRFDFIVYNLLKNSLYYLNQYPDSQVKVGCETRFFDKKNLNDYSKHLLKSSPEIFGKEFNVIYVFDTGPGIRSEIIDKLFNDFFTSGKSDGTGLGLAFCKKNMKLFGGDIICESQSREEEFKRKGEEEKDEEKYKETDKNSSLSNDKKTKHSWTKFSLLFPKLNEEEISKIIKISSDVDKKPQIENLNSKINSTIGSKFSILLADDQKVNLMLTKRKLETCGFKVTQCEDGEELLNQYKQSLGESGSSSFDLILTDINMPKLNGDVVAQEIRKIELQNSSNEVHKIPIIALSGESKEEDFEKYKNCGIDNFYLKGQDNDNLIKMILSSLGCNNEG